MKFFESLRKEEPSSSIAYHLEGLLDACKEIHAAITELSAIYPVDTEASAATLTKLQEEIYFHAVYHMKQLRRPLRDLVEAVYVQLPDLELEGDSSNDDPVE